MSRLTFNLFAEATYIGFPSIYKKHIISETNLYVDSLVRGKTIYAKVCGHLTKDCHHAHIW